MLLLGQLSHHLLPPFCPVLLVALRELRRERAWSRINLVPLLMAEADRDTYRREQAALAREKEIMKDVHGWEVSRKTTAERFTRSNRSRCSLMWYNRVI